MTSSARVNQPAKDQSWPRHGLRFLAQAAEVWSDEINPPVL